MILFKTICASLVCYILISIVGSLLPVNQHFREPDNGIEIFVTSNGVHTDIVVPIVNDLNDWSNFIQEDEFDPLWEYASHIGFGWGDQGFYLNTPEWKDLRINVAVKAVLVPSSSAMHVTLWDQPVEQKMVQGITITDEQYKELVSFIKMSFMLNKKNSPQLTAVGYGQYDLFFEGEQSFHLFKTCNTWTNNGLKSTGIRACLWTFYDRAILWQIGKIER